MAQIFASNFSSNSLSGSTTLINGFANVSLQSIPYALEGNKSFVVKLRRGSVSGEVVATSAPITLTDPSELVSLTANVSTVAEGNLISFTLVTANAANYSNVYLSVFPVTANLTTQDFYSNTATLTIVDNTATVVMRANTDMSVTDEDGEKFKVQLRTTSPIGNVVYTTSNITIQDTSYFVTYVSNTLNNSIYEAGDTITYTFSTGNEKNGRTYYYETLGTATASTFASGNTGSFIVTNNQGQINLTITAISDTQNFRLVVRENSATGSIVATSILASAAPVVFMKATGGLMTAANGYLIHSFVNSGTFAVQVVGSSAPKQAVQIFGVGGGGGSPYGPANGAGGGGGGGYYFANTSISTTGNYTVVVGGGGTGGGIPEPYNPAFSYVSTTAVGYGGTTSITGNGIAANISGGYGGTAYTGTPSLWTGGFGGNVYGTATVYAGSTANPAAFGGSGGGGAGAANALARAAPYADPVGPTWRSAQYADDIVGGAGLLPVKYMAGGSGVFSDIQGFGRYYGGGGGGTDIASWPNPGGVGDVNSVGTPGGYGGGGRGGGSPTYGVGGVNGRAGSGGGAGGANGGTRTGGSGLFVIRYPYIGARFLTVNPQTVSNDINQSNIRFSFSVLNANNTTIYWSTAGNLLSTDTITGNTGSLVVNAPNASNIYYGNIYLDVRSIPAGESRTAILVLGSSLGGNSISSNTLTISNSLVQFLTVSSVSGNVVTANGYTTVVFPTSNTITFSSLGNSNDRNTLEYAVIAGGGGGFQYGGGGAGGFRMGNIILSETDTYTITVGAGSDYSKGNPSTFRNSANTINISSMGGGYGFANPGGSGGGGGYGQPSTSGSSGFGYPSPTQQGYPGGTYSNAKGGGGGGAGAVGTNGNVPQPSGQDAGFGGDGLVVPFSPSYFGTTGPAPGRYFAGGGGGMSDNGAAYAGSGGAGGGGRGAAWPPGPAGTPAQGAENTGGGGGGGGFNGGSGIVIIRYRSS